MRLPRIPVLLGATLCAALPAPAQDFGRGRLDSAGREPRVTLTPLLPGGRARISVAEVQAGARVFVALGRGARIPLDVLGLPGAVLGVDPAGMLLIGPLTAPASGRLALEFSVPNAARGAEVHVQAFVVDPKASPPLVPSDSRSMLLLVDAPELVLAKPGQAGALLCERVLPDGRPGRSLALLGALRPRPLHLAALDEDRTLRPDLPQPVRLLGVPAVRLPDGSLIARAARARDEVLYRVEQDGAVEVLDEAPAPAGGGAAFDATVAASLFGPYIAWVRLSPSPALIVARTDGRNSPGTPDPWRRVSLPRGLVPQGTSLVFGAGTLALIDRNAGFFLIEPETGRSRRITLPPSGGRPPLVYDEECAVSGNGRVFAFGAGSGRKTKDVYAVHLSGAALNVTRRPSNYAEVGYANPGRRTELVLDGAGTRIAYVDEGGKEPEVYVADLGRALTSHLTPNTVFADSIDIGTVVRALPGGFLLAAGTGPTALDLFWNPTGLAKDVVPLTKTSPATRPPWGVGAQLSLRSLLSLPGSAKLLAWTRRQSGADELWWIDPQAKAATSLPGLAGPRSVWLPGLKLVAALRQKTVGTAKVWQLVAVADPFKAAPRVLALAAGQVPIALVPAPSGSAAFVLAGPAGRADLYRFDPGTPPKLTKLAALATDAPDLAASVSNGRVFVLGPAALGGRPLYAVGPGGPKRIGRGYAAILQAASAFSP